MTAESERSGYLSWDTYCRLVGKADATHRLTGLLVKDD